MDVIAKVAMAAVFGYAVLVAGCTVMQRSLMYFPDHTLPAPATVGVPEMAVVTLETEDGLSLASWYAEAQPGFSTIVYFHGNGGNISHRAFKVRPFLDVGYGVLLVSYRGYAGNPGSPTETGLFHDGRAALAFLQAQGVTPDRTVLLGASLGSGVAVRMASETPVQALILESPYTSAVDAGQQRFPFLPVRWLMYDRFDSMSRIDQVTAPLLVVHGEADRTISVDLGRRLFEAANDPKEGHFLPGAGHVDLTEYGLLDIEFDFLARHAPPMPRG